MGDTSSGFNNHKNKKKMQNVIIEAGKDGYSIEQVSDTMTVAELIAYLEQYPDDAKIYLSHDNGYTYGGIHWDSFKDC